MHGQGQKLIISCCCICFQVLTKKIFYLLPFKKALALLTSEVAAHILSGREVFKKRRKESVLRETNCGMD